MKSIRDQLVERRVPQFLIAYVGISWGIVQFVDFLERYGISPHWTDFTLLGLGLLLPSVILFTFNHGKPGKDDWTRTEKVAIPLNVAIATAILFLAFQNKELGATTRSITMLDEGGKEVQKVVPNASFRRRLAMFNFDGAAEDTAVAWLRYALPLAITTDLMQDIFIDVRPSAYFREKLRQTGNRDEVNVPFGLKRSIAVEQHLPYFTEGRVSRNGNQYAVDLAIYESTNGELVERRSYQNGDLFALIDELTDRLREDLGVPKTEANRDLPVSSVLTNSLPAFRQYGEGITAASTFDNWPDAVAKLSKAVALDPTFAVAALSLHSVLLLDNQAQKAMAPLQQAMDHLYRLPERVQHDAKAEYYFMKQDQQKAFAIARMKVEQFPDDVAAYAMQAQFQRLQDDKAGMLQSYEKILELDPSRQEMLREIGALHQSMGDFKKALSAFSQYAEKFPDQPDVFLSIGNLHRLEGEHAAAKSFYERAQLISPGNVAANVGLARVERDLGEFDAALRHSEEALASARTAEDRSRAYSGLAGLYSFRGQLKQGLRYAEKELEETRKVQPPMITAVSQLSNLDTYARAGEVATAERILKSVTAQLQPPFDSFSSIGEMELNTELGRADQAEAAAAAVEKAIGTTGFKILQTMVSNARGRIAELRGQCDVAITHYEAVQKAEPTDVGLHANIARCLRQRGQAQQAIERAQLTLKVVPFDPRANYEIGLAYLDARNRAKAIEHLQRAADVWSNADPAYKLANEARAALQKAESTR
jgi:tetratricopeptide (TPR) repeat protein